MKQTPYALRANHAILLMAALVSLFLPRQLSASANRLPSAVNATSAPAAPAAPASLYTFVLPVAADAEVNTHDTARNYGAQVEMKVLADVGGAHYHRPLFYYDLASVLPGSTIISARANFYVTERDANPVQVHQVTRSWQEDTVTWDSFNESFSPVAAGSFVPDPANRFRTAEITALVQDWLSGAKHNRGLALIPSLQKKDSRYATQEDPRLERHSNLEVVVDNAALFSYADDFNPTGDYAGSDGSTLWGTSWQEIGESDGSGLGQIQLVSNAKCPTTPCLKIGQGNGSLTGMGLWRQVDLSAAVAASLSFSYVREDANAVLHVEVSRDGGSAWHRLETITLESNDGGHGHKSYDITPYIAANTQIRFIGQQVGGINDRGAFIDDVAIAYLDASALDSGIGDRVWDDLDRDGVQELGEPGIAEVQVGLYTGECGAIQEPAYRRTVTNAAGEYRFAALYAGRYCVVVNEATLPANYTITTGQSPLEVTLAANQIISDADFGYTTAFAADRLNVATYAPCADITWLQQLASAHAATLLVQDQETCSFTLGASPANMPGLQAAVAGHTNTRASGPDVRVSAKDVWPDDPAYNDPTKVYGPQQIHAPVAWLVTTGDPSIIVAVVDTGVDASHPEFAGRLLPGWDFVNSDNDPTDDNGHGTHVAGIVAAAINNTTGIAGIAGNVKILPVKVLDSTKQGWWSQIGEGISWAVDQGADIINLSLGGIADTAALRNAINYAISKGVTVIAAAGNSANDVPVYPASYSNVLAFGATSYDDLRWPLSSYGPNVNALAPGGTVYSTYPPSSYRFMSGTSMAAPHAAGLAALLLSQNPNLTPAEIATIILNTAHDMGAPELNGAGLIDAGLAVNTITAESYEPPTTGAETQLITDLSANGVADPGDTVRYLLTVANSSSSPLSNIVISTTVPDNTTYVPDTTSINGIPMRDATSGTAFPLDEGGYNISTVAATSAVVISFDITINPPIPVFHSLYNETLVDFGTGLQTIDVTTPVGGDTCALSLRNADGATITSLRIGDTLHVVLTDPDENTRPSTTQTITAAVSAPATGDRETLSLLETGADTGVFEGNIQVSKVLGQAADDGLLNTTAADQTISASYTDPDFAPDHCSGSLSALAPGAADLRVTQVASDTTPDEGEALVYTVKVKNDGGPDVASSIVISAAAPAGIVFITDNTTHGEFDYNTGVWFVRQLPVGVEATLTIDAEVYGDSGSTISNTAFVEAVDQADPVASNNSASVSIAVNPADLQVTKAVNNASPDEGQTVRYTVNVKNNGPAALASAIVIEDVLPAGLEFVAAAPAQGSYDSANGLWAAGDLAAGANVNLLLDARYTSGYSGQPITNTARVVSFGQADKNPVNDAAAVTLTPKTADLRVLKSVSDTGPVEGQAIAYTVKVKNQGPAALATGVVISDVLPAGLTFASASAGQGSYSSATGQWTVGSLATGVEVALTLNATVNRGTSGQRITNRAAVSGLDQRDLLPANNSAASDIVVAPVDLQVTTTVSDNTPDEDQEIEYTISLKNNGPSFASGVVISDVLPAGMLYVADTPDVGDYDPATGLWTPGADLASGVTKKVVIRARPAFGTSGQTIVNRAALVAVDQMESNNSNDASQIAVTVNGADVAISISVAPTSPGENQDIVYTVNAKHNGPAAVVTNLAVTDLLPGGLTFISANPAQGTYDPATHVWTVGSLSRGQSESLYVTAYVPTGAYSQKLTYQARVLAADQVDPNTGNNSATKDITVAGTDIQVTKAITTSVLTPFELAEYTIQVKHNGPAANVATGVVIRDVLPSSVSFDSAEADQGGYDPATGLWTVGSLASGATKTLVLKATVKPMAPATPTVVNTAVFHRLDQHEINPGNNSASSSFTYQPTDIRVAQKVNVADPEEGDILAFTIEACNHGPTDGATVGIRDVLPAGLTYLGAAADQGSYDRDTGVWTIPDLRLWDPLNPVTATLTLSATVDTGMHGLTITNTASSLLYQPDPVMTNNSASVAVNVRGVDLALTKTVDDTRPDEGKTIVYTIKAGHNGPSILTATNVTIRDTLPAGMTYVAHHAKQGSYDPATGLWTLPALPKGVTYELALSARTNAGTSGQTITNTATVVTLDQRDPDTTNNTTAVSIRVGIADLRVTKAVNKDAPAEGQAIRYMITIKNLGPNTANNVVVSDLLPAGLTFSAANAGQGSYDRRTGLWTVGTVALGANVNLFVDAKVNSGVSGQTITNTAQVHSMAQFDPVMANNSASVALEVQSADVSVTKTVSDAAPDEGDAIAYTVKVRNLGPSRADDIVLEDLLPAGVTYISHDATNGLYDRGTGLWVVGNLLQNATATLTIQAAVGHGTSGQSIVNTATVRNSAQNDPVPANNTASAEINVRTADLRITQTVNDTTPSEGQAIAYTVKVKNEGPSAATGIQVADVLPNGVTFVSASPTQGAYDAATGIWAVGDLATKVEKALVINVTVNPGTGASTIINRAGVFAVEQADALPANNQASVTVVVNGADLDLSMAVDDGTPVEGQTVRYTLTVRNRGPLAAASVVISDRLPTGVTHLANNSGGLYNPTTGAWTIATLNSGASKTLTIDAQVNADTRDRVIVNGAQVGASSQPDALVDNNYAAANIAIGDIDLDVTVEVDDTSPTVGDTVNYTVQVINRGPDSASGAQVSFALPSGLRYAGHSSTLGSYCPATGIWTVGSLSKPAGVAAAVLNSSRPADSDASTATLTLSAVVQEGAAAQLIGATASIAGAEQNDPTAGNNQATATITVHGADLSLTQATDQHHPNVGDTVIYTVTLHNAGPDAAAVEVSDYWPDRVIRGSVTASAGSYDSATSKWTLPSLAAGAAATLQLTGVLTDGVESSISHIAEVSASSQPDGDSAPANHASSEDDYAEVVLFTGAPPIVDGKLDLVYSLSPDVQRVCYTANGTLFGVWHVLTRPADNAIYAALMIDKEFVDNTYGTGAIGWPDSHSFNQLVGSDHAQVIGYDANGAEVTGFKLDYLSFGFATPSGYDTAGALDGDVASVLETSTSLVYNLNNLGYCANGDCSAWGTNLLVNSPATDAFYTSNSAYPNWIYDVIYEAKIDAAVFGPAGYGSLVVPYIHASPSKPGATTIIATPGVCPGEIGDFVWHDADADGLQDESENGLDNVAVSLYRDNGDGAFDHLSDTLIGTETTEAGGRYVFQNVQPGGYFVDVLNTSVPAGFSLNTPPEPTARITLAAGQSYRDADFGYASLDFGDAPDPTYPTLHTRNGAHHLVDGITFLGANVDSDADGEPGPTALGDDTGDGNDDDDGVSFTAVRQGEWTWFDVTASRPGWLNAWIDYTGDGDWADAGEQAIVNYPMVAGLNRIYALIPFTARTGSTYARFRFSTQAGFSYTGEAPDGEVEDYRIAIETPASAAGPGRIGDFVWHDLDGDSIQDQGEPGIGGVMIELTNDLGLKLSATTTAAGHYEFSNLPAGTYTATLDAASAPAPYDFITTPAQQVIVLAAGEAALNTDFGLQTLVAGIGDYIWYDADADGVQDVNEPGIANVTLDLYLDDGDGMFDPTPDLNGDILVASTVSDAAGAYILRAPLPGAYFVNVTDHNSLLAGMHHTFGPQSMTEPAGPITLNVGDLYRDADFGYILPADPAVIGDLVWMDSNRNGKREVTEPVLIGVQVCASPIGGGAGCCDTTDLSGRYLLQTPAGAYRVAPVAPPIGLTPTTSVPLTVTVTAGQQYLDADFGYSGGEAAVGGTIWQDIAVNDLVDGLHNPHAEPGIPNVSVNVVSDTDADRVWDAGEPILATFSKVGGDYLFANLLPGDYLVQVSDTLAVLRHFAPSAPGPNPGQDYNNQAQPYAVSLGPTEIDTTADFGYREYEAWGFGDPPAPGTIGDTIWFDVDGDGLYAPAAGDQPVAGVTVAVLQDGAPYATATTGGYGQYLFSDLPLDHYYTLEVTDVFGVLAAFRATAPAPHPGQDHNNQAQPYEVFLGLQAANRTADFGYTQPAALGDFVFFDPNQDGVQQEGETDGLDGVPITLNSQATGESLVAYSQGGLYQFTELWPGTYTVTAPAIYSGRRLTSARTITVTLLAGQTELNADFGYITPTALDLVGFTAERDATGVRVSWRISQAPDTAPDFVVWRAEAAAGPYKAVSGSVSATDADTLAYTWLDEAADPATTYWYKLEVVGADMFHGPISVTASADGAIRLHLPLILR